MISEMSQREAIMEGYNEIIGHVVTKARMRCETGTPKILVWKFDYSRAPCLGAD